MAPNQNRKRRRADDDDSDEDYRGERGPAVPGAERAASLGLLHARSQKKMRTEARAGCAAIASVFARQPGLQPGDSVNMQIAFPGAVARVNDAAAELAHEVPPPKGPRYVCGRKSRDARIEFDTRAETPPTQWHDEASSQQPSRACRTKATVDWKTRAAASVRSARDEELFDTARARARFPKARAFCFKAPLFQK